MELKLKKFHKDAKTPTRESEAAAGYDLYNLMRVTLKPGESHLFRTGLGFEIPEGFYMMIAPRSSLCLKKHLDMPNSVGIIDADFRGEVLVPYRNLGKESVVFEKGERFAQAIIKQHKAVSFKLVDELNITKRGQGGIGSTGKF